MSEPQTIAKLIEALESRKRAGKPVQFWLRDDDAVAPGSALDQLLGLAGNHGIPLTLAVIPEPTDAALARRLALAPDVSVAVHGWSHRNYAAAGEKSQELGLHRPVEVVLKELSNGFQKLAKLYPQQFVPMLVPPWNRITPQIIAELPAIGYQAVSVFGPATQAALPMINTHVDVIDWRGTRGGRPVAALVSEIITLLQTRDAPIGILTHHLVHDAAVWAFLAQLFAATGQNECCEWLSAKQLLALAAA